MYVSQLFINHKSTKLTTQKVRETPSLHIGININTRFHLPPPLTTSPTLHNPQPQIQEVEIWFSHGDGGKADSVDCAGLVGC